MANIATQTIKLRLNLDELVKDLRGLASAIEAVAPEAGREMPTGLPQSIADVTAERATHAARGWTAEHDYKHGVHHLISLAEKHAHTTVGGVYVREGLIKAASLLVAAIDVLDSIDAPESEADHA